MNKKNDIAIAFFWIGLSIFVMVFSYELDLGDFRNPGPGLMPFLVGSALLLVSIPLVIKAFSKIQARNGKKEVHGEVSFVRLSLVLGGLFVHAMLLEVLGYLVATSLLLILLFKTAGCQKWRVVLVASALTVIGSYVVFTSLGVRFPEGIFGG
jgi:hypothetical protein